MTGERLAVEILGAGRAARFLAADDAAARIRFASWYLPAWQQALDDDLTAEAAECYYRLLDTPRGVDWLVGDRLGARGLPPDKRPLDPALLGRGFLGTARVRLEPPPEGEIRAGCRWRPDPAGLPAITWAVLRPDFRAADIVAMYPGNPRGWASRTGAAAVLPDPGQLADLEDDARFRLHRYPLDWLAAGGEAAAGFCILDWSADACRWLLERLDRGEIAAICDDRQHARELKALARPRRPRRRIRAVTAGGGS